MKQILFFISIFILSFQLLSQNCSSQNIVLKSSGNDSNTFETISTDSFKSQLHQNFQASPALRYFVMKEIEKDPDIISVSRKNDGVTKVFSIVAKKSITASQVDAKIIAGINNAKATLQNYMQQNNLSAAELGDFIKSNLLD